MNRKRNVSFIKPEDPEFLKVLKKQAGYDERNHKFDELANEEDDFADDGESEQPQVVVLEEGDLTAEEVEAEKQKIEKIESETKADLAQKVIFKPKKNSTASKSNSSAKRKCIDQTKTITKHKSTCQLLSFDDNVDEDEE